MVKILEGIPGEAKEVMGHVIEETAHTSAAHPMGLGLQVESEVSESWAAQSGSRRRNHASYDLSDIIIGDSFSIQNFK
jgi:hypothetical protein